MLQPFQILSYILITGWAVATVSSSEVKFPAKDGENLPVLGSLEVGFGSDNLHAVPPEVVLAAVKMPGFEKYLETLAPALKTTLVEKLAAAVDDAHELVRCAPDALVPYIPLPLLGAGNLFSIEDLNHKPWTPEQAAMFFDGIAQRVSDFNSLSPFILRGFTCTSASDMNDKKIQALAKAMKQKEVQLKEDQLSCLAKLLTASETPKDFDEFPRDLFLFLSPSAYAADGNCKEFIARVGEARIEVLEKGSPQREKLLSEGLACLNIHDLQVSQDEAETLGHLVCDLDANYLAASGQNLLKQLNQCLSFTPDQIKAIRDLLSGGNAPFGPPSTWSSSTLDALNGLFPIFGKSVLESIPRGVLIPWLNRGLHASQLPREHLSAVIKTLQPSRQKRLATEDCPPDKVVTEAMLKDSLMPIYYTPNVLKACVNGPFLLDNLPLITSHAYTDDQMLALKENLDQMFPGGYPDVVVRNLGVLLEMMNIDDIKKWNMTSPDVLGALLGNNPTDPLASQIIQHYIDCGNPMTASALNAIGSRYICLLNKDQLNLINEQAIKDARPLEVSKCPQATVDNLYPKAKRAFSDHHNEFPAYYNMIEPYLRGASAQDLKALSKSPINMPIRTFMSLKNDTIMKLTPGEVKGLLGTHVDELKDHQFEFPIKDWIQKQKQADLDVLGLSGGIPVGYIILTRVPNRNKRQVV